MLVQTYKTVYYYKVKYLKHGIIMVEQIRYDQIKLFSQKYIIQ